MIRRFVAAGLLVFLTAFSAFAVNPDEVLDNPEQEARARALSAELRCMVCQNQSIDASNAELARDLRLLVRARIKAGDTDREVLDYVVSRYGEFVLLKPRFGSKTLLLWGAPILLFLLAALVVWRFLLSAHAPDRPLSRQEEEKLKHLLSKNDAD